MQSSCVRYSYAIRNRDPICHGGRGHKYPSHLFRKISFTIELHVLNLRNLGSRYFKYQTPKIFNSFSGMVNCKKGNIFKHILKL